MKIKKISLLKYGPLEDRTYSINQSFQCITGPNESGKTLLIDAIIKFLLPIKTQSPYGKELHRISEPPHGLLLMDLNGEEVEVSGSSSVDLLNESLEDIRDLLIIRNSDLEILKQESCFDRATDKLLGLRSADINVIIAALKAEGSLTEKTLEISRAGSIENPGNQLDIARQLLASIKNYLARDDVASIKNNELEILEITESLRIFNKRKDELNKARNLREYKKLEHACQTAEKYLEEISVVPEDFIAKSASLLKEHSELAISYPTDTNRREFLNRILIILSIGSLIGVILSFVLQLGLIGIIQSFGVLVGFILVLYLRLSTEMRINRFNRIENEIKMLLESLSIETSLSSNYRKELQDYLSRIMRMNEKVTESLGIMKSEIVIENTHPDTIIKETKKELQKRLPDIDDSITREYNHEQLKETDIAIKEKGEHLSMLKAISKTHLDHLADFETRLGTLRFEKFLGRSCRYITDSMDSLNLVVEELSDFIDCINSGSANCKIGIEIFSQMDDEEKEKVTELLNKSKAVDFFKRITGGRYTTISYNHEAREVLVQKDDGKSFETSSLSKGTLDQLYLSLRIGLAGQIFGKSPGFFIMDDPFLASDTTRRDLQIAILEEILHENWQILYFTANQTLADKLHSCFGGNAIVLDPLQ
ncbi:MAG: AAA family ATPase [Candidatus Thorarchaeota archaeon]|nr:AAA family ATPase [Candidatus Thorarchaeota archaeon]